jgi:Mn2+/Fe2+ NRAMP family transporter
VHSAERRRIWIRRFCVFYPLFALVLYFAFRDPRLMVIMGGFVQAATLPVISAATIYMRYRRLDPRLAPSRITDICLWLAFISITLVAGYAIWDWALHKLLPALTGSGG